MGKRLKEYNRTRKEWDGGREKDGKTMHSRKISLRGKQNKEMDRGKR